MPETTISAAAVPLLRRRWNLRDTKGRLLCTRAADEVERFLRGYPTRSARLPGAIEHFHRTHGPLERTHRLRGGGGFSAR
ncbi:MAG: hypothetical protein NZ533_05520 [Casimicrobiaceae bacterium]|nr:hypothetical protein [Casimicrobiaceae bacterium]MDW8312241.1 hypothetical protein [Burkholderiales bacterium]